MNFGRQCLWQPKQSLEGKKEHDYYNIKQRCFFFCFVFVFVFVFFFFSINNVAERYIAFYY